MPTSDDATVAENMPANDDTPVAETNSLPTMAAPEEAQAWSEDTDETPARRYGPVITAGLVALVVGIAGTVTWLAATGFHQGPSKPGTPSAIPTTTMVVPSTPVAASAPPVTSTVQLPTPAPGLSDDDRRLLHNLRSADGYEVDNPALVVEHAHRYCALVQQGLSGYQSWQTVVSESHNEVGMHSSIPQPLMGAARTPTEMAWNWLTAEALAVYPNCTD